MTGKIKSIGVDSGLIEMENGTDAPFQLSDVLTYDRAGLAVDQLVSFDIGRGNRAKATNIVVRKPAISQQRAKDKRAVPRTYRYIGFEQLGASRAYSFEELAPGEHKKVCTVTIDTALFGKHGVGMQEGPALCLRLLMEGPDISACTISDEDMQLHVSHRPVCKNGPRIRKFTYTPGIGVRSS